MPVTARPMSAAVLERIPDAMAFATAADGYARALEIAAFDEPISSARALEWGLVTKVAADGQALDEACGIAGQIARGSLNSFAWSKKLITDSFNTSFETHLENERAALEACADHPDGREGLSAFSEKRKPRFGLG